MKGKLKIFYVSPEVAPFVHSTDLGEVASALPKYLKAEGHDIRVMMPNYRTVNERKYVLRDVIRLRGLKIKLGNESFDANGKSAFIPNSKVQIYFLDNRKLFDRESQYQDTSVGKHFEDNARRFIFFAYGCLETLKLLYWQPDVIHCNDWQTALIPFLLKTAYKDDAFFKNTRTLLSIHNPTYCGVFDASVSELLGEAASYSQDLIQDGKFSFLYSGISYADSFNTAIDCSAQAEIGCDANVFDAIRDTTSIYNGIDSQVWDPATDKLIPANYGPDNLAGKGENREALLGRFQLTKDVQGPVMGVLVNSVNEESLLTVLGNIEELMALPLQIVIVGDASPEFREKFQSYQTKYPGKLGLEWSGDPELSHLVEAGSDLFFTPSLLLGGLGQLSSQVYGTIPITCSVGIRQPLETFDVKTGKGTAFSFDELSTQAFVSSLKDAIALFREQENWTAVVQNAMEQDVSWEQPGQSYMRLYGKLVNNKSTAK